MNSQDRNNFDSAVESFKVFEKHNIPYLIAMAGLRVAKAYHGGEAALIKHILENRRDIKAGLSEEDIADIEEQEKEERERAIGDFTPNLDIEPFYLDSNEMGSWLWSAAQESDEKFDEVFERLMIGRYRKAVVKIEGETKVVYEKARSLDECEEIITGYE